MDIRDLEGMEDITFKDIDYKHFVKRESKFILRTEVEGVQVALIEQKRSAGKNKHYRLVTLVDGQELCNEYYPHWDVAYDAYKAQRKYVRGLFTQSGRKEVFYYKNKYDNVVSVIYS